MPSIVCWELCGILLGPHESSGLNQHGVHEAAVVSEHVTRGHRGFARCRCGAAGGGPGAAVAAGVAAAAAC